MGYLQQGLHKFRKDGLFSLLIDSFRIFISFRLWFIFLFTRIVIKPINRSELPEIADNIHKFGNKESISIQAKEHDPKEFKNLENSYTIDQPFVAEIKHGHIFGPHAIGLSKDYRPINETMMARRDKLEDRLLDSRSDLINMSIGRKSPTEHFNCCVFPVTNSHYPHWILNELPRIIAIKNYSDQTGNDPKIIIPGNIRTYQRETFELLGIELDRVINWEGNFQTVENLVIPTVRSLELHNSKLIQLLKYDLSYKITSPEALCEVRDTMHQRVEPKNRPVNLFIARTDTNKRRVLNREDLMEEIRAYGFDIYVPGNHSLYDQISTFASAEIIISPHGGGLANLTFTKDTTVIELFGRKVKPTFFLLAQSLDIPYHAYMANPVEKDLTVKIPEIIQIISDLNSYNHDLP